MSLDCIGNKTKYYVDRNLTNSNPTKIIIKARQPQQLQLHYNHNNLQHQQQDNLIENMSTSQIISRNNENKLHLPITSSREPPPLAPISSILSNGSCGLRKSNIISNGGNSNNNNCSSIIVNKTNSNNNNTSTKIDISVGTFMLTKGLNESCGSPDGGNSNSSMSTNNSVYTNTTMDSGATSDTTSSITKFKFDFDESAPLSTTTSQISSSSQSANKVLLHSLPTTSTSSLSLPIQTSATEQNHSNNDGEFGHFFVSKHFVIFSVNYRKSHIDLKSQKKNIVVPLKT